MDARAVHYSNMLATTHQYGTESSWPREKRIGLFFSIVGEMEGLSLCAYGNSSKNSVWG
jgi:hypothetical protein